MFTPTNRVQALGLGPVRSFRYINSLDAAPLRLFRDRLKGMGSKLISRLECVYKIYLKIVCIVDCCS